MTTEPNPRRERMALIWINLVGMLFNALLAMLFGLMVTGMAIDFGRACGALPIPPGWLFLGATGLALLVLTWALYHTLRG